jgi:glucokinase
VTLSAQSDLEAAVIARARDEFDHVSAERLVSGSGLPTLYRCLADVLGEAADPALDDGARITEAASASALAAATIDLFGAFLGGFAGNVALTLGARGGVWIAGGIAPRLVERLAASPFRQRFECKGRFQSYLEPIGTAIITRPDPALGGLAFAIEQGG